MEFKKKTTHVVIKFDEKTVNGKDCIDLIPLSWIYIENGSLTCKYPDKKEYSKINEMSRTLSDSKESWKGFGISIISEARNYEQGVRRMNKAFSNTVVLSSAVEDKDSSEYESDPKHLSGDKLGNSLKDIPSFSLATLKNQPSSIFHDLSMSNLSSSESSSSSVSTKKKKYIKKKLLKKRDRSCDRLDLSQSNLSSSELSSSSVSTKKKKSTGKKLLEKKDRSCDKLVKVNQNKKYCPTCGRSDNVLPVSKSDLESLKRSIEYRIQEESKITRSLLSINNSSVEVDSVLKDHTIISLPKTTLEHFQEFDKQLEIDNELVKKMKCFMILNVKGMAKINDNIQAVIPKIISKDVQLLFSAFGRETNGKKKLNFSRTNIFKYLHEVLTTKHPDVTAKEFSSVMSRWFSGAKDREGGKKLRQKTN